MTRPGGSTPVSARPEATKIDTKSPKSPPAAELHFPTAHLRRFRRKVWSEDRTTCYEETVLQQRWLPMVAGQGREAEWRDVPVVVEGEDG